MSLSNGADAAGAADVPAVTFDTSKPNIARVYDYWLGGKDSFAADREEAERMLVVYPYMRERARENRLFLARAVTWLAEQGIRQFLDVGSGLPTVQNTHETAQKVDPACRVAYVDYDPTVVAHAKTLLSGGTVAATQGDVRDPASILANPAVLDLIRPEEPVGLIVAMVLHFFDAETAREIVAAFASSIAPGSYIVLSIGSGDERACDAVAREYQAGTFNYHPRARVAGFFQGLELVGTGLTDARDWDLDPALAPAARQGAGILAGIGRKPSQDPR
jgi:O-methyltransferase involved in polyketide biosynthesis